MSATPEPTVRWADPADLPRLEAFWIRQFGPDSVQAVPGRVAWLFAAQPAGLWTAIAEAAGEIVAACGHLVQTVDLPGHGACEAAFGVDFMVAPEFRRRGLGGRLLDLRLERFPLSLSTGQSGGMAALYRERGAVDLGSFNLARFRRRPGFGDGPRGLVRDLAACLASLKRPRLAGRRLAIDAADDPRLASDLPPDLGAWLRWRCHGPVYRDHLASRLDAAHGQAILYTRREAGREVLVHTAGALPRRDALALAAGTCPAPTLEALTCGRALTRDLQAAGFLVRPYGARLVGMSADPAIVGVLGPGVVDLFASAADADLLRRPAG